MKSFLLAALILAGFTAPAFADPPNRQAALARHEGGSRGDSDRGRWQGNRGNNNWDRGNRNWNRGDSNLNRGNRNWSDRRIIDNREWQRRAWERNDNRDRNWRDRNDRRWRDYNRDRNWNRNDWRSWSRYDYARPDPRYGRYYADRYYRDGRYYGERRLGWNDRIYRGYDGRYYCRRSDGTTGLILGALAGGLLGDSLAVGDSSPISALIGGGLGALIGREIDRGGVSCR